jgi:DNA processing protein
METSKQTLLHLSLIKGIGPGTIQKIVASKVPLSELYQISVHDLCNAGNLSEKIARVVVTGLSDRSMLEKELELLEKYSDIQVICFGEQEYPELLSHIHYPPPVLYVRGTFSKTQKTLACVGARRAKQYARRFFESSISDLVRAGWTIVSGGAYGADTMAHEVTLQAGGKTIAVLGSGLLCPYPYQNIALFERIVQSGGSIISSFSLKTDPLAGNFPARNRIISGLSAGCIVVQAAQKSGALITAYAALEQGRQVFAVPGAFDEELSFGCHALIRDGACIATSASDILNELDPMQSTQMSTLQKQRYLPQLSAIEQTLFEYCCTPRSIDELVEQMNCPLQDIMTLTLNLQLKGLIKQHSATGLWEHV